MPADAIGLVVNLVVAGSVGLFGFFARKALSSLEKAIDDAAKDLRDVARSVATHDVTLGRAELEVANLKAETHLNRDRYHQLSQEVTALRGWVEVLKAQHVAIERAVTREGSQ